jgi:HlyD family secretion protein
MKTSYSTISALAFLSLLATSACKQQRNEYFEGKVKRETISLAPKYAGRIIEIRVNESDEVNAGDTLAVLDIPEVNAKMQQAKGALFSATGQYEMALHGATKEQKDQVMAMYKAAKDQYDFAKKSLERVQSLFNDSLVAPQAYDEASTRYNMALAQYQAALAKRQEVEEGTREEQIRMALGQKKQAEGAVNEAEVVLSERFIVAPKQMTIETIALKEGELALPGYNIFVGYEPQSTWFRFTISESLIGKFKRGETYKVELPFGDKETFNCKLIAVNELSKYGNRTTAYPAYELGEAVYELKFVPEETQKASMLFNNATVLLEHKK